MGNSQSHDDTDSDVEESIPNMCKQQLSFTEFVCILDENKHIPEMLEVRNGIVGLSVYHQDVFLDMLFEIVGSLVVKSIFNLSTETFESTQNQDFFDKVRSNIWPFMVNATHEQENGEYGRFSVDDSKVVLVESAFTSSPVISPYHVPITASSSSSLRIQPINAFHRQVFGRLPPTQAVNITLNPCTKITWLKFESARCIIEPCIREHIHPFDITKRTQPVTVTNARPAVSNIWRCDIRAHIGHPRQIERRTLEMMVNAYIKKPITKYHRREFNDVDEEDVNATFTEEIFHSYLDPGNYMDEKYLYPQSLSSHASSKKSKKKTSGDDAGTNSKQEKVPHEHLPPRSKTEVAELKHYHHIFTQNVPSFYDDIYGNSFGNAEFGVTNTRSRFLSHKWWFGSPRFAFWEPYVEMVHEEEEWGKWYWDWEDLDGEDDEGEGEKGNGNEKGGVEKGANGKDDGRNAKTSKGQVITLELNMNSDKRTLFFIMNGKRRRFYFRGLPSALNFYVEDFQQGNWYELLSLRRVRERKEERAGRRGEEEGEVSSAEKEMRIFVKSLIVKRQAGEKHKRKNGKHHGKKDEQGKKKKKHHGKKDENQKEKDEGKTSCKKSPEAKWRDRVLRVIKIEKEMRKRKRFGSAGSDGYSRFKPIDWDVGDEQNESSKESEEKEKEEDESDDREKERLEEVEKFFRYITQGLGMKSYSLVPLRDKGVCEATGEDVEVKWKYKLRT